MPDEDIVVVEQGKGYADAARELSHVHTEGREALQLIESLMVNSEEDQAFAAEILREVKEKMAVLEQRRTSITKPMNQALREVNSLFRPPREVLERAEQILKRKIADYQQRQFEAQRQAARAVAEAATTPQMAQEILAEASAPIVGPPKGVSIRHVWKATVVDANALPRQYLMPNIAAIEAAAPGPIPGVTFEKVPIVTARR